MPVTRLIMLKADAVPAGRGTRVVDVSPVTGIIDQILIHFAPGCFLADTPILMVDAKEKAIQRVSIGDKVCCHRGYGEVTQTNERDYSGDIITIKPRGLSEIFMTPNHPLLVVPKGEIAGCGGRAIVPQGSMWDRYRRKPSWEPRWIPATELGVGDWLISPVCDGNGGPERIDMAREFAKTRFYLNGWLMTPIRRLTRHEHKGKVYNFTVNPQNSYIAGKVAVHNCNGLVDVAIGHGSIWVAPALTKVQSESYIALNAATPVFDTQEPVKKDEQLWLMVRNRDGFNPHTITAVLVCTGEET